MLNTVQSYLVAWHGTRLGCGYVRTPAGLASPYPKYAFFQKALKLCPNTSPIVLSIDQESLTTAERVLGAESKDTRLLNIDRQSFQGSNACDT